MKTFGGPVLFLDRSDINTDEIIPAKYLTAVSKEALKLHCLEDLKIEGFSPADIQKKAIRVIVTRSNFGCGSSREHAPWALEANGITVVVAESFARIFRQNMFNCGMMAIELPAPIIDALFKMNGGYPVDCNVDLSRRLLTFRGGNETLQNAHFELNPFDEALVKAGGWLEFADARY